jgi:hypothetical protein
VGLTTLHHKNEVATNILKEPWSWMDSLEKRPKWQNIDMSFGTWDVTSLYRVGSLVSVLKELSKYARFSRREGDQMGEWCHRTSRRIHVFLWKGR